ncbi:MAG: hypothetical protein ACOYWZ_16810 [Bacillota bacterium]
MNSITATQKHSKSSSNESTKLLQSSVNVRVPAVRKSDTMEIIQRVRRNPNSLTRDDIIQLQNTIGNRAVMKLLSEINNMQEKQKDAKQVQSELDTTKVNEQPNVQEKTKENTIETASNSEKDLRQVTIKNEKQQKEAENSGNENTDKPREEKPAEAKPVQEDQEKDKKETVQVFGEVVETSVQSPETPVDKNMKAAPQKEEKASESGKQTDSAAGGQQQSAPSIANLELSSGEAMDKKAPSKALKVTISAENPGQVIEQLVNAPPTAVMDAYSQAVSVSAGALESERIKTQEIIPAVPTPTGLAPKEAAGRDKNKINPVNYVAPERFKSEQSGGNVNRIMSDFNVSASAEDIESNPDSIMSEVNNYTSQAPEISMTGEADPTQVDGFKNESAQMVKDAQRTELSQVNSEFGENSIYPQPDNTVLKARKSIQAVTPPSAEMLQIIPVPDVVKLELDQSLAPELQKRVGTKTNEYQQGKTKFDADVIAAKTNTDSQIKQLKADTKDKQLTEQAAAKAEVEGLRGEWRNEIDQAVSEYDQQADARSKEKRREISDIKEQKEGEVEKELDSAEKEANKEYKTAKEKADEKKKEGEKDNRSWLEKAWDWAKEKVQQFVDSIKQAITSIFDGLRKAVKFILDKAKQAVTAIIEMGRKLIVGIIKGLGTILKGLVKIVFAKFPAIADKICGKIDQVVNKAVNAVNKAADLLKKGVSAALDFFATTLNGLFSVMQSFFNGIISDIGKILRGEFKEVFEKYLEGAIIAAEIAAAFASGGGSILIQIGVWLGKTLPELFQKLSAVKKFVDTIRNIKIENIVQLLEPGKLGAFLAKGLFGELPGLPVGKDEGEDKEKEPAGGREERGLLKVFSILSGIFNFLKGAYGKVAGAVNKVLPIINITNKPWFETFSAIYAAVVKALEVLKNPAQMLAEGTGKLKESVSGFFKSIKSKVVETAEGLKEKIMLIGKPAQLMKLIANKAVDMVLNFIITHPPSALIKAAFKVIEAASGKSVIELVRQHIPFADKLINKIAESGPVRALLQPLEQPVKSVGGMIDQVSEQAVGMVDESEKKAVSNFGSSEKLLKELVGNNSGNKSEDGSGSGKEGGEGGEGGDFLGSLKSGVHKRMMRFGELNLLKKGTNFLKNTVNVVKGLILGRKINFKIDSESHQLWVEKRGSKLAVMMASNEEEVYRKIEEFRSLVANIEGDAKKDYNDKIDKLVEIYNKLKLSETMKDGDREQLLKEAAKQIANIEKALKGRRVNFGEHLRSLIGDPPSGMIDPHAHHILFKEGHGATQKALVKEGQALLRRYNIDPIMGKENLVWAPNRIKGQHNTDALRNVVDKLKQVENAGGDRDDIVKMLRKLGELAAERR